MRVQSTVPWKSGLNFMLLDTLTVSGRTPGPHLLITGGVHGDEYEPMAAIRELARILPADRLTGRVTLVPVVNVASYWRGQRTAEDGLDLARTCPGDPHGTITQQTAAALSELIRTADLYIDLHTGGVKYDVWPLAGYVLHPDVVILETQRRMAFAMGLPLVWGTDWRLEGRSLSVARDAKVPAIYAEYRGGGGLDPQGVQAYVQGCLRLMLNFGLLPSDDPLARMVPAVEPPQLFENAAPGSGHLQINHPAPCDGFFSAAVKLGQTVSKGDRLGTICNILGTESVEILSRYSGLVVTLHRVPVVHQNDGVAVVIDCDEANV